ncbi:TetR/AcrR family transcriptional regulator [Saccharothrix sp. S26]|uniref:TetR/AcrR family transcriptional regulator n=1 Tax=Saccharothrix sp. S26 TaxID=2907215 RepID=UPI001F3F85B9|nr:TetR/AcrR family transcriptional regulator [Saccharothrix sp. S26]MCE6997647.1 TetR/AcrR family transcriptional regulator [Saccharothrix sp. S26]
MPRPKEFDEEQALDAAMRTFWVNGYEATSTEDLCRATGLGRSSIYNTFSSKHELFKRSLVRYTELMTTNQLALLDDETRTARDRVHALFDAIIAGEVENRRDERGIGCLTVNTTVELAARDPEAAALVARDQQRRLDSLEAVIRVGQRDGQFTSRRSPAELARFLNAVIAGLRVAGQGGADIPTLKAIADTALEAL